MTRKSPSDDGAAEEVVPLEFLREVEVVGLNGERTDLVLTATDEENAALARRFDVDGISNLVAQVTLTPFASGNKVAMKTRFAADIAQTCVVTLAPLTNYVSGEFFAEFVQRAFNDDPDEIDFSVEEDDPPEPIIDGRLEMGELIAQNLGLAIDPFPRVPGAVFEGISVGEEPGVPLMKDGRPNPFAVLERLKNQKN